MLPDDHVPSANPGFPSADWIIGRYALRSDVDLDDIGFYRALGFYKLATIAEGIHQRHLNGLTVGTRFRPVGDAVTSLVDAGLEHAPT